MPTTTLKLPDDLKARIAPLAKAALSAFDHLIRSSAPAEAKAEDAIAA